MVVFLFHFCFIWLSWDSPFIFPETNERICFLNGSPDEVIRSLFYNKNNDSLITVSVYGSENFSALRCRTTRIEYAFGSIRFVNAIAFFLYHVILKKTLNYSRYIRRGQPDAGFPLFETESLKWPGFVEFDDVNGKVLTYSAQDRYIESLTWVMSEKVNTLWICSDAILSKRSTYKVFDLKNYTLLYSVSDKDVQEIKIRYFDVSFLRSLFLRVTLPDALDSCCHFDVE